MEPIFPLVMIVAIVLGVAASVVGGDRWKQAAEKLGLEYRGGFQRQIEGMIEGYSIVIKQQKNHIDIRLSGGGAIRDNMSLDREGFLSGVLGGRDIEIGCPVFDSTTYVSSYSGNADAEVSALLDEKTRAVVSRVVVMGGAKVARGGITHMKSNSIDKVPSIVGELVELARHLSMKTSEIPARLARNALSDGLSSVRLHNLTLLQQRYPTSDEARETSATLLTDSNHSIRLAAAMFADDDAPAVVREIALDTQAGDDVRIKAVQHLVATAEGEEMVEIASSLLTDASKRLRRLAIQSLGRLQHRPSLEAIVALLNPADVATSLEIIKAVENIGDSSAEGVLIRLLGDVPNRVRLAAIEALGKIGTIAAVEPLHALTKRMRFKRSARVAIAGIQSRLGDVESGRLSLVPAIDPSGALSLAGDPEKAGGLSLDEEDEPA